MDTTKGKIMDTTKGKIMDTTKDKLAKEDVISLLNGSLSEINIKSVNSEALVKALSGAMASDGADDWATPILERDKKSKTLAAFTVLVITHAYATEATLAYAVRAQSPIANMFMQAGNSGILTEMKETLESALDQAQTTINVVRTSGDVNTPLGAAILNSASAIKQVSYLSLHVQEDRAKEADAFRRSIKRGEGSEFDAQIDENDERLKSEVTNVGVDISKDRNASIAKYGPAYEEAEKWLAGFLGSLVKALLLPSFIKNRYVENAEQYDALLAQMNAVMNAAAKGAAPV